MVVFRVDSSYQSQEIWIVIKILRITVKQVIDVDPIVSLACGLSIHFVAQNGVEAEQCQSSRETVEMEGLANVGPFQVAVVPGNVEANGSKNRILIDHRVNQLVVLEMLSQDPQVGVQRQVLISGDSKNVSELMNVTILKYFELLVNLF